MQRELRFGAFFFVRARVCHLFRGDCASGAVATVIFCRSLRSMGCGVMGPDEVFLLFFLAREETFGGCMKKKVS